ncbi:MAG TPA: carboxypeptidase regulatory-like domain-containing protein [Planctomycetaceae bacterium]|nr:carboxypeptidase regulatory-like domain-containing protein [Planctomycetaceae bacterium]
MLKRHPAWRLIGAVLLTTALFVASGCGGGAPAEVSVNVKSSEAPQPASEIGPNGGTPPSVTPGQPGRITGTVTFDGTPPSLPLLADSSKIKPDEASVCKPELIGNDSLVVNPDNKGVAFVFVYLEKLPRGVTAPKSELPTLVFDNKNCRFVPHGIFVQTGQTVNVTNSDPILHNTHTFPKRTPQFNQAIPPAGAPLPLTYARPEQLPVEVKCDLHTWMKGLHLVLDHHWGAVTDEDGRFELPELPPGRYELKVWHERPGLLERSRRVQVDGDVELNLSYGAARFARYEGPRPKSVTVASR